MPTTPTTDNTTATNDTSNSRILLVFDIAFTILPTHLYGYYLPINFIVARRPEQIITEVSNVNFTYSQM
jgi:hypothetical protein